MLLKNEDNLLPLSDNDDVVFIGKYAKAPRYQGGGSSHINSFKVRITSYNVCYTKLLRADVVGTYVTNVFSGKTPTDGAAVVMAAFLFSVQIYCDFAGYSEIASGSARLMGIHLMKNFDRPYAAIGIRDFWKRWHISLTSWFKDYIYIPLGGSRRGKVRHQLAILVVFLVSGLWHGASWTFLLWGLFHAGGRHCRNQPGGGRYSDHERHAHGGGPANLGDRNNFV